MYKQKLNKLNKRGSNNVFKIKEETFTIARTHVTCGVTGACDVGRGADGHLGHGHGLRHRG